LRERRRDRKDTDREKVEDVTIVRDRENDKEVRGELDERVREREKERESVCVCVRARECVCVCVCVRVCVREGESEKL
jgi:hypothetical protein